MKEEQNKPFYRLLWFWVSIVLSLALIVVLLFMICNNESNRDRISHIENKSNIYKRNAIGYRDEILSRRTVKPQDSNYNYIQDSDMVASLNKYIKVDNGLDISVSNIETSDMIAFKKDYGSGTHALVVHVKVKNNTGKAVNMYPDDFDVSTESPNSNDSIVLDSITNENGIDIETNDNILVNPGNSGGLNLIFAQDSSSNKFNIYYQDGIWQQK
ncbi:hypothetical protein NE298_11635 [Lactococcus lactis]|uniref:hypothetical protein n=1 Tax=Lactococcus lactis TaxID=1358 RepID=UPI0020735D05|nr:hypothetical protein [Lactococcus lactis]MCM6847370.1 hypothetical protein [Lactococcus lactis]